MSTRRKPRRRNWGLLAVALAALFVLLPDTAMGQALSLDLGDRSGSSTARIIQLILIITVLSIAPSILIMVTSFTRIVVVLSFLRQSMGTQQTPPNQVLISLALFLSVFIMMPTFQKAYDDGVKPLIEGQIEETEAIERTVEPFRTFMMRHVRERDLLLFTSIARVPDEEARKQMPLRVLVPAFMISELRRAFEIGFLIFVPFLIIDMVVASILMSMGMMMLPPVMISLPFKLIFFVLVDGWYLVAGSLIQSYGAAG